MDIGFETDLLARAREDYAAKKVQLDNAAKEISECQHRLFLLARLIIYLSEQLNEPIDQQYTEVFNEFRRPPKRGRPVKGSSSNAQLAQEGRDVRSFFRRT